MDSRKLISTIHHQNTLSLVIKIYAINDLSGDTFYKKLATLATWGW